MKYMLMFLIICTTQLTFANEVPKVTLELCDPNPHTGYRDYWDRTGHFCANGQFYDITDMGEIKLRDNGQWSNQEYAAALSPENRAVVEKYKTYYVRYFATRPIAGEKVEFVAHVFFSWGTGTQTVFVLGEYNGEVKITGYSNSKAVEGTLRTAVETVTSLFSSNGSSAQQDNERIRPVGDVVRQYRGQQVPLSRP